MTKVNQQPVYIERHPLAGPLVELRAVIHPLTHQGEDRIWRAAEKACALLDKAEDEKAALLVENERLRAMLEPDQLIALREQELRTLLGDSQP